MTSNAGILRSNPLLDISSILVIFAISLHLVKQSHDMKRVSVITLTLIAILLFTSCKEKVLVVDRFPGMEVEVVNNTEYDCSITWMGYDQFADVEQTESIPAGMTFTQKMRSGTDGSVSIAGQSNIIYAQNAVFKFYNQDVDKGVVYSVVRDVTSRVVTIGKEWTELPHFSQNTVDEPGKYCLVIHLELSDILPLSE